jgi:predicted  nucleic acid-binding Zn-ribbon protein
MRATPSANAEKSFSGINAIIASNEVAIALLKKDAEMAVASVKEGFERRIAELEKEHGQDFVAWQEEINDLRGELGAVEQEADALRDDIADRDIEIQDLTEKMVALESELRSLQEDCWTS